MSTLSGTSLAVVLSLPSGVATAAEVKLASHDSSDIKKHCKAAGGSFRPGEGGQL
jgi:hypothetical protein